MSQERQESGRAIDFQKVFMRRVIIRADAPPAPGPHRTGRELLHGYLCDILRLRDSGSEWREVIDNLCHKWSIIYERATDPGLEGVRPLSSDEEMYPFNLK